MLVAANTTLPNATIDPVKKSKAHAVAQQFFAARAPTFTSAGKTVAQALGYGEKARTPLTLGSQEKTVAPVTPRKLAQDWTAKPSSVPNYVLAMSQPAGTTPATLFKSETSPTTQIFADFKQKKTKLKEYEEVEGVRLQKSLKALQGASGLGLPPSAQVATVLADTLPVTGGVREISTIHQAKPFLDNVQEQYRDLKHRVQIDQSDALKQFNDATSAATSRVKKEKEKNLLVRELEETKDIYVRFELLTLKLIDQSEVDANELYNKIEARTNEVETLNKLLFKINNKSGELDLSSDEGKVLILQVRGLGVEIPEGKYKWTEEEKKLLKENINMVKDSKEKFTQLERIKLQRHMQNISHHYQALSNNQRVRKEAYDTIIHNMRP